MTLVLPASPNWYCSKVADGNESGLYVFGAKSSIYVYRIKDRSFEFIRIFSKHRERVAAVHLSQHVGELSLCCSASDDGTVLVWDSGIDGILHEHCMHTAKLTAMSWSPLKSDLIVTADEKGTITSWSYGQNRFASFVPENGLSVTCLACSTLQPYVTAVGYRNSIILLVHMEPDTSGKTSVLHRLRGHENEIQTISWCSLTTELSRDAETDEPADGVTIGGMIASSSRDRTIRVWSLTSDRTLRCLKLPNTGYRRANTDDQRTRLWVAVYWPPGRNDRIICSSFNGELILWDIASDKPHFKLFDTDTGVSHHRIVFSIASVDPAGDVLATISMDRQVILWSLSRVSSLVALPTFGGFVYKIRTSPVNQSCLAVGVGDNTVRIWRPGLTMADSNMTILWQGIKSKVTALDWHPSKDNLLAFGTEDGKVGIFDVFTSKPPQISSSYHKRIVYVVAWGPPCQEMEYGGRPAMFIYSVGDGVILQHNPYKLQAAASSVTAFIAQTNNNKDHGPIRSEICWKPDFSAVAIGSDDGSVEIYKPPTMKLICTVRVHQKLINSIQWHPDVTATSPKHSPMRHWLASASTEKSIHVTDLTVFFDGGCGDCPALVTESRVQLEGHSDRVTELSWSPHEDGKLVSVSYDGTAQVWNAQTGDPIANYSTQHGRLLSCQWSHLDPDLITTGGDNHNLHQWKISEQTHRVYTGPKKSKQKPKSKPTKSQSSHPRESQPRGPAPQHRPAAPQPAPSYMDEIEALLELKTYEILQRDADVDASGMRKQDLSTASEVSTQSNNGASVSGIRSSKVVTRSVGDRVQPKMPGMHQAAQIESEKSPLTAEQILGGHLVVSDQSVVLKQQRPVHTDKGKGSRSYEKSVLFPECRRRDGLSREAKIKDIILLAKIVYSQDDCSKGSLLSADNACLGLYLDRRAMYKCLNKEVACHQDHDNMDYLLQFEIWKGNIGGALKRARERDQLSDWLVAMAPMVSHGLWVETCDDYARQLEIEGQYHKAATYYLAAHRVYEAIDLFRRHRLFREAVMLAKLRLSPMDSVHEELYMIWAHQLTKDGHFEQAAKCYLAIKQVKEAAKVLARRSDQLGLQAAAHINLAANEKQEALIYAQKVVQQHLVTCKWDAVYKFCKGETTLQAFHTLASLHELFLHEAGQLESGMKQFLGNAEFTKWPSVQDDKRPHLPEFILDTRSHDNTAQNPWLPHLVNQRTFPHHVYRHWYEQLGVSMDWQHIQDMYQILRQAQSCKQQQTALPQLVIQVCYDLCLCLFALLLSETTSAVKYLLQALATAHNAAQHALTKAICRLFMPLGAGYILKVQQEVTALRVIISMESSSPASYNEMTKVQATKKFWSEPKDDDIISNSNSRCRELDCLRAYYYLCVLGHLKQVYSQCNSQTYVAGVGKDSIGSDDICDNKIKNSNVGESVDSQCERSKSDHVTSTQGVSSSLDACDSLVNGGVQERGSLDPFPEMANVNIPKLTKQAVELTEKQKSVTNSDSAGGASSMVTDKTGNPMETSGVVNEALNVNNACLRKEKLTKLGSKLDTNHSIKCTLDDLLYLSKCILWDVQARKFALTETLGYVHRAISHKLLDSDDNAQNKPKQKETSNNSKITIDEATVSNADSECVSLENSTGDDDASHGSRVPNVSPSGEKSHQSTDIDSCQTVPSGSLISGTYVDAKSTDQNKKASLCTESLADEGSTSSGQTKISTGHNNINSVNITLPSENTEPSTNSEAADQKSAKLSSDSPFGKLVTPDNYMLFKNFRSHFGEAETKAFTMSPSSGLMPDGNKSRKILWEDEPGANLRPLCANHCASIPNDWIQLPADVKYLCPFVTLEMLQQEQDFIQTELRKAPDNPQLSYPMPLLSAELLLEVCKCCPSLSAADKQQYTQDLTGWAASFTITTDEVKTFAKWHIQEQELSPNAQSEIKSKTC